MCPWHATIQTSHATIPWLYHPQARQCTQQWSPPRCYVTPSYGCIIYRNADAVHTVVQPATFRTTECVKASSSLKYSFRVWTQSVHLTLDWKVKKRWKQTPPTCCATLHPIHYLVWWSFHIIYLTQNNAHSVWGEYSGPVLVNSEFKPWYVQVILSFFVVLLRPFR
jgi:hypothetical protein